MSESGEKESRPEQKMGKLVILKNGAVVDEVQLVARKISIGRDAACDVHLNDLSVSRHHASLTRVYEEYFIEDLESTNGTFLNHRQVSKHMLKHNDVMRIGGFTLHLMKLDVQVSEDAAERDLDRTVLWQAGNGVKSGTRHQPSAPETAVLRFTRGPRKGQSEQLGRSLFTLGKAGGELAAIARRPQGYFLLHIGGSRHPRINGREINTTKGIQLNEGDRLEVGEVSAEISFRV